MPARPGLVVDSKPLGGIVDVERTLGAGTGDNIVVEAVAVVAPEETESLGNMAYLGLASI